MKNIPDRELPGRWENFYEMVVLTLFQILLEVTGPSLRLGVR